MRSTAPAMKAKSGRGVTNPQQQRHDNHNSWTVSYCGGGCCRGQQLLCKSRNRILNFWRLPTFNLFFNLFLVSLDTNSDTQNFPLHF